MLDYLVGEEDIVTDGDILIREADISDAPDIAEVERCCFPKPWSLDVIRHDISENGKLAGTVFSTLPSGMETTVKISLNGTLITGVVFGKVDYPAESAVRFDIKGSSVILFDARSRNMAAMGELVF